MRASATDGGSVTSPEPINGARSLRSPTDPRSIVVIVAVPWSSVVTLAPGRPASTTRFLSEAVLGDADLGRCGGARRLVGQRDDHATADGGAVERHRHRRVAEPRRERVE